MRLSLLASFATLSLFAAACTDSPCDSAADCQEGRGALEGKADGLGKQLADAGADGGEISKPTKPIEKLPDAGISVDPPKVEVCPTWTHIASGAALKVLAGTDVYYLNPSLPPKTAQYAGNAPMEYVLLIPPNSYTASNYVDKTGFGVSTHLNYDGSDPIKIPLVINHWYASNRASTGADGTITVKDVSIVFKRYASDTDAAANKDLMESVTIKAKGPFQLAYAWGTATAQKCSVTGPDKAFKAELGSWQGAPGFQDYYTLATGGTAGITGAISLK